MNTRPDIHNFYAFKTDHIKLIFIRLLWDGSFLGYIFEKFVVSIGFKQINRTKINIPIYFSFFFI